MEWIWMDRDEQRAHPVLGGRICRQNRLAEYVHRYFHLPAVVGQTVVINLKLQVARPRRVDQETEVLANEERKARVGDPGDRGVGLKAFVPRSEVRDGEGPVPNKKRGLRSSNALR